MRGCPVEPIPDQFKSGCGQSLDLVEDQFDKRNMLDSSSAALHLTVKVIVDAYRHSGNMLIQGVSEIWQRLTPADGVAARV